MSTLRKIIVISGIMLAFVNLFADPVEGSGAPWGVKGSGTYSLNYGLLGTNDYGVFGKDSAQDNIGYLGGSTYGAFGRNNSASNYGFLGSSSYGAYGRNNAGSYGFLGSSSYGVYGRGTSSNYGYLGGSSYAVYGMNNTGNCAYLGGSSRSLYAYAALATSMAAVLSHTGGSYLQLGADSYGAYIRGPGSAQVTICSSSDIGIGAYGPEDAAYFTGDVTVSGDLYVTGDKDNVIKLNNGTWVTMSATEAPYPEYTISGRAKLANGSVRIDFEEPYPQVISNRIPIKVIVTAEGSSSVIYVKDVDVTGFTAASEIGDRNATFSWMAIARVKGREQKQDYKAVTEKMQRLEASQKYEGLSTMSRPSSRNEEDKSEPQTMEMLPEFGISVTEMAGSGSVGIYYQLPEAGSMTLSVFDASGRLVRTLSSGHASAGGHSLSWNRTDDAGRHVPTGVYFVRLDDGADTRTAKVTIVK